jgi:hypothetical protein
MEMRFSLKDGPPERTGYSAAGDSVIARMGWAYDSNDRLSLFGILSDEDLLLSPGRAASGVAPPTDP